MKTVLPLLAIALLMSACGSPGTADVPDGTRDFLENSRGGDARSASSTNEIKPLLAGAQYGDVSQAPVDARATRSNSISAAGHNMRAFELGGSIRAQDLEQLIAANPVIDSLRAQIAVEVGRETPDGARLDALNAQLSSAVDKVLATMAKVSGGDLSGLTSLTVINWIGTQNVAHDPKALTPEEAAAAASGPERVVKAARGGQ